MDAGVAYFPTHDALGPAEVARLVEERGHRWLLWAEHTHIPAARETAWGGREDAPPLPRKYARTYDPFVASAYALAATQHLRVGTGIALVPQRDPIVTAKEVASLDHLSGGRFELGVGAGWNREEMANHGVDPRTRMRRMREHVLAMKEIWTQRRHDPREPDAGGPRTSRFPSALYGRSFVSTPASSSRSITRWAASSGVSVPVSSRSSGCSGGSYRESMPVKFLRAPRRAFA